MKKKLLELLNKKQSIVNRMKSTNEAGDTAGFAAAQNELADVDAEIARVQAIMDAEASVPAPEDGMPQEPGAQSGEGEAVNSAECMHAFAECIRAQARGNRRAFDENADIVRRAAAVENANQMTEGTPADGGLIVPEDVQTTINELRRSLVPLADLFSVENVSFLSGTRVVDTQPTKGFTKMDEMDTIPNDDKPVFAKLSYKVEDYGLFLPVSNDLLRDTDEALLAYISRWMAKKQVITENNLLVTKLAALDAAATAATAANVIATLKKLLNVSLDPAISATAHFIVNQDGFNALDQLLDANKRPLLQPLPARCCSAVRSPSCPTARSRPRLRPRPPRPSTSATLRSTRPCSADSRWSSRLLTSAAAHGAPTPPRSARSPVWMRRSLTPRRRLPFR